MQHRMVGSYRRFGTTYQVPFKRVKNSKKNSSPLCNIPEERITQHSTSLCGHLLFRIVSGKKLPTFLYRYVRSVEINSLFSSLTVINNWVIMNDELV